MTENDRTVQVPVSLIKRAAKAVLRGWDSVAVHAELTALLSQPTPTAEPSTCEWCGLTASGDALLDGEANNSCGADGHGHDFVAWAADPPRVEDMAPGTRFVGRHVDPEECGGVDHAWFVIRPGARPLVASDEGQHWSGDSIDPSTIRDVTPPKDAA